MSFPVVPLLGTVAVGNALAASVAPMDSAGKPFVFPASSGPAWTCSDATVLEVVADPTGLTARLVGLKPGTAKATVSFGGLSQEVTVTVTPATLAWLNLTVSIPPNP